MSIAATNESVLSGGARKDGVDALAELDQSRLVRMRENPSASDGSASRRQP